MNSKPKNLLILLILLSLALPLVFTQSFVQAQDTPEPVREVAINALNSALPGIGRPDSWRHVGLLSTQSSALGCVGAPEVILASPISYYEVWLNYDAVEYQINVAADASSFVYCDSKIPGSFNYVGSAPPVSGESSGTCQLSADNVNVRQSPSTDAAVVQTITTEASSVVGRTPDNSWYQITEGWLAASVTFLSGDCSAVPITGVSTIDFGNCPIGFSGYMNSRLAIGERARVEEGGVPNRVRSTPSITGENLFQMASGTEMTVLNGPQCGNGIVWWQIQTDDNRLGWTAESDVAEQDYYLELVLEGIGATNGLVDYENVSFQFPVDLASDVLFALVPGIANTDATEIPYWATYPPYREFTFMDFAQENDFDPPAARIQIYPTADLFAYSEGSYNQWVALSTVLNSQANYPTDTIISIYDDVNSDEMPALPLRNAAQVFATQIRFVEFENGVGVRYLSRYAQAPFGTTNSQLFYTFQGLTYDNAYYVVVDVPVSSAFVPDTWTPPADFDVNAIAAEDVALINQLMLSNPADFTPDLSVLDNMITTLTVE